MRHVNLLFVAATILCGPLTALRAEPLPASDSAVISARDVGPPADARQAFIAAPRPPLWSAASREAQCSSSRCWKVVLLGVGY